MNALRGSVTDAATAIIAARAMNNAGAVAKALQSRCKLGGLLGELDGALQKLGVRAKTVKVNSMRPENLQ